MCEGNGGCLTECACDDSFNYKEQQYKTCKCNSEEHYLHYQTKYRRYCKVKCKYNCQLINCKNINYCESSMPKWLFDIRQHGKNGTCNGCLIFDISYTNMKDNCVICSNNKYLIKTKCNHEFCNDCLLNIGLTQQNEITPCPICRKNIELLPVN